mgnify:CR=1 FL=1
MSDQPPVRLDVDADGIATLTLNRPEQLNAFDLKMMEAWRAALASADWIVDALLGTGAVGEVRPPLADLITVINESGRPVFAVDLPSGLDADTGRPQGIAIRATLTGTFVACKRGFQTPEAALWTGRVVVLDIGAPRRLLIEAGAWVDDQST